MTKKLMIGVAATLLVVMLAGAAAAAGGNGAGKMLGGLRSALSEKFGITQEELKQSRTDGQTLRQLLESKGVNVEDFVASEVEARKALIAQLVSQGKLTEEQAEACLADLELKINARLDSAGCQNQSAGQGFGKGFGKGKMKVQAGQCFKGR